MHMAPSIFQLFFQPVCWLCCILVPSFHLWRQVDWMKTSLCQSLSGCTYPSLFHVIGRPLPWTSQNRTVRWDVLSLCQRKFSHSYSIVLLQRYPTLHCQQCWLFFHSHFHWWQRCGFDLNIPTDLSYDLCLSLSLSCVSLKCNHLVYKWGCDPQSLSFHKHSGYAYLILFTPHSNTYAVVSFCALSITQQGLIFLEDNFLTNSIYSSWMPQRLQQLFRQVA